MSILREMLSYAFLTRALIVGVLVSLCSALLGVPLVLKRYSMIGDGLSHVGFGALAVAAAANAASTASTALSYGLTSPVVGATKLHHIEGAAGAVDLELSPEETGYLEEPYVPHPLAGVMAQNKPAAAKEKHVWSTGDQKIGK